MRTLPSTAALAAGLLLSAVAALAQHSPVGYTDTPYLPDGKWRVHDLNRPHPKIVTPGATAADPPADAVVLFSGKDLSKWDGMRGGKIVAPSWKVENGYMEVVPETAELATKEKFGDMQLHVEWASPSKIEGESQDRGNSGIILMGRYEIQVLDSYNNLTYADGQAAAMYGQFPPLANVSRKPGEWQTYDIIFEAPRFENGAVKRPAYVTVLHNGVLMHNHQAFIGRMEHRRVGTYAPHSTEESLVLQNHNTRVRYRNIWMRRIGTYDPQ